MDFFTVSNLLNGLMLVVAWSIRNELHYIRESINNAKELASDAKNTALRAHERIDFLIEHKHR